ncbi:hypothetical protein DS472_16755 [Salmonella enterica subsp. enterica serovar Java]|nr:hypothetical protein [Salmonella enterica subsp. enterica serovar Java]EBX7258299.1 hypothetical protein [Salmonella enterica subsp. enterica serovar Java]EDH9971084.1 hypothetical protein [Salmonella enterica subsp. enterica serovar Java]
MMPARKKIKQHDEEKMGSTRKGMLNVLIAAVLWGNTYIFCPACYALSPGSVTLTGPTNTRHL